MLSEIKMVCHWGKRTYGAPRIARAPHQPNIPVPRQKVARLMKKGNIRGVIKKMFKAILILDISIQYRKTGWGGISGLARPVLSGYRILPISKPGRAGRI